MASKYEIIEVNEVDLTVDLSMLVKSDVMFFNATEMASAFGKRVGHFLASDTTKEYIMALNEEYGDSLMALNFKAKPTTKPVPDNPSYDNLVRVKKGGKYQGTWLHQKLALQFARWLSPRFAIRLDKWIIDRYEDEKDRRRERLAAKTGYLELSEAVMKAHKEPKSYHFSNEANLLNRIVIGMDAKKYKALHKVDDVRDHMTVYEIEAIKELQVMNTALIKLGNDYPERKAMLSKYFDEKLCPKMLTENPPIESIM